MSFKFIIVFTLLFCQLFFAQQNTGLTGNKLAAIKFIEQNEDKLSSWSDSIWKYAEPYFKEVESAGLLINIFKREGFTVTENVCGLSTVFMASYGNTKPVIGLYGEYDADSLSSNKIVPRREEFIEGGYGHGAGHNLIAVGSLGAALAIKELIQAGKINCTVRYYGTTSEGVLGAKSYLARDGFFNDLDFSLYWHPSPVTMARTNSWDALLDFNVNFTGKRINIIREPSDSGNTLSAFESLLPGIKKLRESANSEMRISYIITKGGKDVGYTPDTLSLAVRIQHFNQAETSAAFDSLLALIKKAAEAANVEFEIKMKRAAHQSVTNIEAMKAVYSNMEMLGPITYGNEDEEFSKAMQEFLKRPSDGIKGGILPFSDQSNSNKIYGYASDIGDASWFAPQVDFIVCAFPSGVPMHQWQGTAFTAHSIGHKAMIYAAKVLSCTAIDFIENESLQKNIRKDFEEHTKHYKYKSFLPAGIPAL